MTKKLTVGQRVRLSDGNYGEVGIIRGNMAQVNGVWNCIKSLEGE